jgi:hypothetical protein
MAHEEDEGQLHEKELLTLLNRCRLLQRYFVISSARYIQKKCLLAFFPDSPEFSKRNSFIDRIRACSRDEAGQ